MSTMILAAATAALPAGAGRQAELIVGRHRLHTDPPHDPGVGSAPVPTPLGLLVASLAACTATAARTVLERHLDIEARDGTRPGAEAKLAVDVSFDIGPPTVVHRRVRVGVELPVEVRRALLSALEHTPVTDILRSGLVIRTRLERFEASPPALGGSESRP